MSAGTNAIAVSPPRSLGCEVNPVARPPSMLAFGMTSPATSWTIAPAPQIAADATQKPIALVMCAWLRRTIVPSQNQKTVRKTRRAITAIELVVA